MVLCGGKDIAFISIFSALTLSVAYAKGVAIPFLPGVVEFMSVLIFVSGFSFGWLIGALIGAVSLTIYMLIPYPFAHPAAWLFAISPLLILIMAALGLLFGVAGGLVQKLRYKSPRISLRLVLEMGLWGALLTFIYDILSSVGFYLAYPVYPSVWHAIYLTFIPLYYPYPPIIHTITNAIVFAILAPPLINAIKNLPILSQGS